MSKMGEIFLDKSYDFERLHENSMKWNADTWADQVTDGRFKGNINFNHGYIYY